MAQTNQHEARDNRDNKEYDGPGRSEELTGSPMMAHLLNALEQKTDIGHHGRFVFVSVARHFLSEDELIGLLQNQPDMDEEKARAFILHIAERGYNPPRRERILEMQKEQEFPILPDADDPDAGNLYRELRFPDAVYDHINEYYAEKAEAASH